MSKPAHKRTTSGTGAAGRVLLAWYARHKRELPWRRDRDPYRVWVSEIMLQQTRVAAVLEHYHAFIAAFPTLEALARAPEERVLARWSGLGYYRRARMLHQAARQVVSEAGGIIPRADEELRKLPGVGRYTAAAIASIAFGEPLAVLDGNVERVLSRLDGEKRSAASAWKRAQELLDRRHPGDWNQAMMELGATVCTPQNPRCGSPRRSRRASARPRPARRRVQTARNLIERKDCIYLVQRPASAAKMAGMWELPECALPAVRRKDTVVANKKPAAESGELGMLRHSITDTDYEVRVFRRGLRALDAKQRRAGSWVARQDLFDLPLTGLTRKILRRVPTSGEFGSVVQSQRQL